MLSRFQETPLLRQSASCIHRKIHTGLDVNACIHYVSTGQVRLFPVDNWTTPPSASDRLPLILVPVNLHRFDLNLYSLLISLVNCSLAAYAFISALAPFGSAHKIQYPKSAKALIKAYAARRQLTKVYRDISKL